MPTPPGWRRPRWPSRASTSPSTGTFSIARTWSWHLEPSGPPLWQRRITASRQRRSRRAAARRHPASAAGRVFREHMGRAPPPAAPSRRLPCPTSPRAVSSSATTRPSCRCRPGSRARDPWRDPPQSRRHDDGQRLAALIALRDQARRVLQSQNEDWPEAHRHQARRELNRVYDRFVLSYGPINKTTLSVTAEGTRSGACPTS